jgi:5-methylcytosine-specific restriction endonuclease McrA
VDTNFAWLAIRLRLGCHWFSRGRQLCHRTIRLAIRIWPGCHWVLCGRHFAIGPIDWQLELDQGVT